MADFAANYTNRYRIRYQAVGKPHSITFRGENMASILDPDLVTEAEDFLNALAPIRVNTWLLTGAEYAQAGSNFFLPATLPTITPGAVTSVAAGRAALNINFQGLSSAANRGSLYVYGLDVDPIEVGTARPSEDYRLYPGEEANVAAALAVLNLAVALRGIDGLAMHWHQYANVNINSHWQRKLRG